MKALKIGTNTNSLVNHIYSTSETKPEVGKGATLLKWTDRSCYEVISVAADGLSAVLESLTARANPETKNDYGHENWILEPTGNLITIVCKKGVWGTEYNEVVFTKEFEKKATTFALALSLTPEERLKVYDGDIRPKNVVEGITRIKKGFSKLNLVFGVKDYHYDWTF